MHERVSRVISGSVAGNPVISEWIYSTSDQYSVLVVFKVLGEEIEWRFSRELLQEVKDNSATGFCDVMMTLDEGKHVFNLYLRSPEGTANLVFFWASIDEFLFATYGLVPQGTETYDTDALIQRILEQG